MQMNEKTMVADTLTGINGELVRFGEMIAQIYFRLSPGILAKVDALAEERGVSRSAFLRQVILSFLGERQGEE